MCNNVWWFSCFCHHLPLQYDKDFAVSTTENKMLHLMLLLAFFNRATAWSFRTLEVNIDRKSFLNHDKLFKGFGDFNSGLPLKAVKKWCKVIRKNGDINFLIYLVHQHIIRAKGTVKISNIGWVEKCLLENFSIH